MDLRQKSVRSGIVVTATSLGIRFLQIVSTIILARLLDPSDFGLIALVHILIGGFGIFSTLGLSQALIATKENTQLAAFQTFFMTSVAGVLLAIAMYAVAGAYADFYDTPELTILCQVMALIVLFDALRVAPDALLMKEMLFGRRVLPTIVASLSGIGISLSMAVSGFGVWSLVAGAITVSLLQFLGIAIVCPERSWMRWHQWDNTTAKRLLVFGSRNLSTWVIQYYYNNVDNLVVGKLLGARQLGFYSQGFSLSNMVVTSISSVINSVLLPAYSKISEDKQRLANAYLKSFQMISVVTVPLAMGLFVVAPEAVIVLIGEKWREAIPILQVFAFMSLIRPLSGSTSPLFLSLGFPQYNLRTAIIQAVCLTLLIFPFLGWGIAGVALAVVCAFSLGFAHNLYLVCRKIEVPIRLRDILGSLLPSLLAGTVMTLIVFLMKIPFAQWLGDTENVIALANLVFIGILSYAASLFFIERRLFIEILETAGDAVRRRKRPSGV